MEPISALVTVGGLDEPHKTIQGNDMNKTRSLRLLTAAFLVTTALAAVPASADALPRTFTVSGHGEERGAPDIAMVTTGVRTQASTAKAALAANTNAMNSVFKAMKALGIADKDMQTSNFSVQPIYKQYPQGQVGPQVVVAYQVSNDVTVTVRQLARLGEALDAFVSAGSNEVEGVSFSIDKPDALVDSARVDAVKDAIHKANLMAQAAGVKLGKLITMSESGEVRPMPAQPRMMSVRAEKASVPIAAGEQQLDADVSLTYEIQ